MRSLTTRPLVALLALAALMASASCTDPLVTGDYRGEPLMTVQGRIVSDLDGGSATRRTSDALRVAVFWTREVGRPGLDTLEVDVTEQQVVTRATFPARYAITIYRRPSDRVLAPVPQGTGSLGVALLLLYWDDDGDGRWDRQSERLAGGTNTFVLAWADGEVRSSLVGGRLAPGYHLMQIGAGSCDGDADLALMRGADARANIDLTITDDLDDFMPDADCDGFVDVCEDILLQAEDAPGEERDDLLEQWRRCVDDVFEPEAPTCEELLAAHDAGEPVEQEWPERLAACMDGEDTDLTDVDAICTPLLELTSQDCPDGDACQERYYQAFELCHEEELRRQCLEQADGVTPPEDPDALVVFAECLLSHHEEPPPADDCYADASRECEQILAPTADGQEVPDDVWLEYERCLEERAADCDPNTQDPDSSCDEPRQRVETCTDPECFYASMDDLASCMGGQLHAEDAYLCEWWYWHEGQCEGCDPNADLDQRYQECLQMYGFAQEDPDDPNNPDDPDDDTQRLDECELICEAWRQAQDGQDPEMVSEEDVSACEQEFPNQLQCR